MTDLLNTLSLEDLAAVVNRYPWYGDARKELCVKMSQLAGADWGSEQYAEAALYLPSRRFLSDIARKEEGGDYSDKDVESLLRTLIADREPDEKTHRMVRVVGGDYFTQEEYNSVRNSDDYDVLSSWSGAKERSGSEAEPKDEREVELLTEDFCSEYLAQIFAEQGYPEEAKRIYSKLILAYPEKSAYFASLIEKLA